MSNYLKQSRIDLPHWGQQHLAPLLGLTNVMLGRYVNGLSYPAIKTMQKFELVFGWPVREQVDLIPWFWEWPTQGRSSDGIKQQDATDLRYGMKLQQVIREWCEANPRTQKLEEIRMHPAIMNQRYPGRGNK